MAGRLDGRGLGVALVRDGAEELGRQPEVIEWHGSGAPGEALPRGGGARSGRGMDRDRGWQTVALTGAPVEHVQTKHTRNRPQTPAPSRITRPGLLRPGLGPVAVDGSQLQPLVEPQLRHL